MILRDGRRQVHDLGPIHTLQPWLMEPIGYTGKTGSGGWDRRLHAEARRSPVAEPATRMTSTPTPSAIVAARPLARRPVEEKRAYDRAYSRRNRAKRREQLKAWRARGRLA